MIVAAMTDVAAMTAGMTVVAAMTVEVGMIDENVTAVMTGVTVTGTGVVVETGSEIGHFNFVPLQTLLVSEKGSKTCELCHTFYIILIITLSINSI